MIQNKKCRWELFVRCSDALSASEIFEVSISSSFSDFAFAQFVFTRALNDSGSAGLKFFPRLICIKILNALFRPHMFGNLRSSITLLAMGTFNSD